ncbi:DNA-directed RNA polymerase subunit K [Thermogladius sp. KZ2Tp1]|uniref:DNA-directed RNA polymerase subunit K n=1 Tax=unclassified Thermogladius TaxID=2647734 RepID=UPI003D10ACFE
MSTSETEKLYYSKLTRFEVARVVGARALQLAYGAPPLFDISSFPIKDPVAIAIAELIRGLLPMSIKRRGVDGSTELVPVNKLITDDIKRYLESILDSWGQSRRL